MTAPAELVLASGSLRRHELLRQLGLTFRVAVPDVDETPHPGESPRDLVARLARTKAVAVEFADAVVLAADTVVDVDGAVLNKPTDDADARRMLRVAVRAVTTRCTPASPCAVPPARRSVEVVSTVVRFVPLTTAMIDQYIATGEPTDKAGAYAIQGRAGAFVDSIVGSPTNVIGLPLATVVRMLGDAGIDAGRADAPTVRGRG